MKCNTNIEVSFYSDLRDTNSKSTCDLIDIFYKIKDGKWKTEVEACRSDITLKKSLPCFTPSGVFSYRNSNGLTIYSGVICLDIDAIDKPEALKEITKKITWIWVSFITPSGKGLKIFVLTDSISENFKEIEEEIASCFYKITGGIERDVRSKDLARLQFVSYDPGIYINPNPIYFSAI